MLKFRHRLSHHCDIVEVRRESWAVKNRIGLHPPIRRGAAILTSFAAPDQFIIAVGRSFFFAGNRSIPADRQKGGGNGAKEPRRKAPDSVSAPPVLTDPNDFHAAGSTLPAMPRGPCAPPAPVRAKTRACPEGSLRLPPRVSHHRGRRSKV